ncbi:hypothetical protein AALB53_05725 [Lachnospiraceae bacterium 47-T17]
MMIKNNRMKRTMALTLVCILTFLSVNVTQSMADEIPVNQETLVPEGIATAYVENEDGTVETLDCEVVLNAVESQERTGGTIYTLEVTASTEKNSTDSKTQYGTTLRGTLRWRDNLGMNNTFLMVFGNGNGPAGRYSYEYGRLFRPTATMGGADFNNGGTFYNEAGAGTEGYAFYLRIKANLDNGKEVMLQINTSPLE